MEDLKVVSVSLTVYNEGKGILRILKYIDSNSEYINDLFIVSDACRDSTDSIITQWLSTRKGGYKTTFIQRPERLGRASAIRECIKGTEKDIMVVFSGDISPTKASFKNLISYFSNLKVGGVTGHPIIINGERTIGDCLTHVIWASHDRVGELTSNHGNFFHLNGDVFAIRKSTLHGFDSYEGIVEDALIGYLIMQEGHKVLWAKDVQYLMRYPSGIKDWLRVRRRCCFGRVELAHLCGFKDYPYYELKHSAYFANVLKATKFKPKRILALPIGVFLELLCRIYYQITYSQHGTRQVLLKKLWEPAGETKW